MELGANAQRRASARLCYHHTICKNIYLSLVYALLTLHCTLGKTHDNVFLRKGKDDHGG
jgi:hypothetical protein